MKSIMIGIKPEWVEKILNGEKTIEIRKTMPKCELPIKVYVYCAKRNPYLVDDGDYQSYKLLSGYSFEDATKIWELLNGKVVAEFTLTDIDDFLIYENGSVQNWNACDLEKSCLSYQDVSYYIGKGKTGYALHIDDLKIYYEPKELDEFYKPLSDNDLENGNYDINCGGEVSCMDYPEGGDFCATCKYGGAKPLKKAPSGFCYVEEI